MNHQSPHHEDGYRGFDCTWAADTCGHWRWGFNALPGRWRLPGGELLPARPTTVEPWFLLIWQTIAATPVAISMGRCEGIAEEIAKFKDLKEQGVLSSTQFEVAKAKVLGT